MSTKYLLPCACGKKIGVELAQAGQQVRCACGAELEVPTMRGLAGLEHSESTDSAARKSAAWGPRQALFVIGLLIAAGGFGAAAWIHARHDAWERADIREQVDYLSVSGLIHVWTNLEQGPEVSFGRIYPLLPGRPFDARHKLWAVSAGIAGLLIAASGLFVRKRL